MINNIQTTNFNPAFNARVHVTSEAYNFFTQTKRMTKDALKEQQNFLKNLGSDNLAIVVDYDKMTNSMVTKIDRLNNGKVFSGETRVAFYKPEDSCDLSGMAMDAIAHSKVDITKSPDIFDFMA